MQKQKYSNLSILEQQQRRHENAVKCAHHFVILFYLKTGQKVLSFGSLQSKKLGELDEIIKAYTRMLGIKQFNK